ncbi:Chromate resistance protein ChrB [Gordoniibacillus kamchatkensis]
MRVRVWRNLKALGVVYIQQSVCVAPDTPEVRRKIQQMEKFIQSGGGETFLMEVVQFADRTEEHMVQLFNDQRTREYEEFFGGCDLFLKEIENETKRKNFTFHEVEENETDLGKLKKWYRKIMKRDFFHSPLMLNAKNRLDLCERKLAEFTEQVYRSEGHIEGQIE